MWDGDIAALRYEYLFGLAHVCHVSPAESWDLLVVEFGLLIKGIDEYFAAQPQSAG